MTTNRNSGKTPVGVVGVGSMGKHHARVYEAIPDADLVGVTDDAEEQAVQIADKYGTTAYDIDELLERVEAVSVAVPTEYHLEIGRRCLEAGVDTLIEKPIASSVPEAEQLIKVADDYDAVLQVGHIERFNPAVQTLNEFVDELDIISVEAKRLGPAPVRHISDSAVLDLMIHDIDIMLSLIDEPVVAISGGGVRENRHATATLTFESDIIGRLTASRLTQKKVRKLNIVATNCLVELNYMDKSIDIHRQSRPEYITEDTDLRYRHESLVERPMVDSTEPLVNELRSFIEAVETQSDPVVTGDDGLWALFLATKVDQLRVEEDQTEMDISTGTEVRLD